MIRLVLADGQTLVRRGIRELLGLSGDIEVVADARDGYEAVDLVLRTSPDVALLEVWMSGANGLDALREMRRRQIKVRVILLATFDDDDLMQEAIRLGAWGWMLKDVTPDDLVAGIRAVALGRRVVTPFGAGAAEVLRTGPGPFPASDLPATLSNAELEILRLIARGMSNGEIARSRGTAVGTVKNQASNILQKLGVRDRTRAVLRAAELGLL